MYSSRDNWERLVTAVVRKQQIWELFHSHSRSPSISTIASAEDDNDDHFNQQFFDSKRWAAATSVSPPAPLQLNNRPTVSPVGNKSGGANITRKLFPANWYKAKKTKQEYDHIINIPGVSTFSLNELEIATDNFSDRNILSKNGFNMSYKGRLANGVLVAIKRYKQLRDISPANLQTMSIVNAHPNLLRLIGICVTQKEKMIIHPYMANGSVASCLRDRLESQPPLDWQVRKHIAFGAARGLAYLHGGCEQKIIFRDVKAANIYLNEDFDAIIGDFELAIHMDHGVTHVEDAVRGTIGHIAPEYLSMGTISEKSDVYGYGMFLLELITGQRAFDLARLANDEDVMLLDWVKTHVKEKVWERIVDPYIGGNSNYYIEEEVKKQLIQIALLCTQDNPERRPNMLEIVRMMLQLGDGLLLAQKWEYFLVCNEEEEMLLHQELMKRSNEPLGLMLPESPKQSEQLSSPR